MTCGQIGVSSGRLDVLHLGAPASSAVSVVSFLYTETAPAEGFLPKHRCTQGQRGARKIATKTATRSP